MTKIILASSSPRRQELLSQIGINFEIFKPGVSESINTAKGLETGLADLALTKARSAVSQYSSGLVLGADTVVVNQEQVLTKPDSHSGAWHMLEQLSGQTCQVVTGLALYMIQTGAMWSSTVKTEVTFKVLSRAEIKRYIQTQEIWDKAGGFAVQGVGAVIIKSINGDYFNAVGLSVYELNQGLKEFGLEVI